jgi:hypothetical protein
MNDGNGCDGKRRWSTRGEALEHIPRSPRKRVRPYFCQHCSHWHNGTRQGWGVRYRPFGLRGVPDDEAWEALG